MNTLGKDLNSQNVACFFLFILVPLFYSAQVELINPLISVSSIFYSSIYF